MGLFALCAFSSAPDSARAQAPAQANLAEIHFSGLSRYPVQQVIAASQLKPGTAVTAAEMQAASDRLAKLGVFDRVSYNYTTRGNDLSLEFQVVETRNRILPCAFDNFVWFSTDEIDRTLRARVPLYSGSVPEGGTLPQQVADTLQAMLRANGVNGSVSSLPTLDTKTGQYVNFSYRVSGVSIPVRVLHFPGASAISESELESAAKDLINKDYSATDAQYVASLTLLPIYRRRGYLNARFDSPQAAIAGTKGAEFDISVTLPVNEGVQFSWNGSSWSGNHTFSSDQLTGMLSMKPREVANQDKISAGLKAVLTAYSRQGYIDATMKTSASLDAGSRLVAYDSALDEGIQYKMGQLHITGLPDKTAAELLKKWPIKPGQAFDGTYADEFLMKVVYPKIAQPGKAPPVAEEQLRREKENGTVDLTLAFR